MFYLYFICEQGNGNRPVKIGYSADPDKRCQDLQTGNPRKLHTIIKIPFETEELAREAEQTFQSLAGKKHRSLQGEWFMIYGDWNKFVAEAMKLFDHNQKIKGAA